MKARTNRRGRSEYGDADGHALSPMEHKVMRRLVRGMTVDCVADELGISRNTADTYVRRIYAKLGVHSRAEAVAWFCHVFS